MSRSGPADVVGRDRQTVRAGALGWGSRGRRRVLSAMGVERGIGVLFDGPARRSLTLILVSQVVLVSVDSLAVLAVFPLAQLLLGSPLDAGFVGRIHALLPSAGRGTLIQLLAALVLGGALLKTALSLVLRWWMHGVASRLEIATARRLLEYYLHAPYTRHKAAAGGEFQRNVSSAVQQVYTFVVVNVIAIAAETISLIGLLLVLVIAIPGPAAALTAYFAVALWIFSRVTKGRMQRAGEELLAANLEVAAAATEALEGYKDITLRGTIERALQRYTAARDQAARSQWQLSFIADLPKTLIEVLFLAGIGFGVWLTLALHGANQGLAMLGLMLAAGLRVLPSVIRIASSLGMIRAGQRATREVLREISLAVHTVPQASERHTALGPWDQLVLDGVSYEYPDERGNGEVVSDLSVTIPSGSSLGIVGSSGAGKTTVLDLLLGFLSPTRGRITIDGVELRDCLPQWRASLGFVPQEVFLAQASFVNNIAFGDVGDAVDEERLASAIELAQLTPVIARFPRGVHANIGARGKRLSGGERQRVGIARALYRRPSTLILDEATAALDNITEASIASSLAALQGRVTVIVVAHRLSTVRSCDRILFLEHGRLRGLGSYDELVATVPDFAALVRAGESSWGTSGA